MALVYAQRGVLTAHASTATSAVRGLSARVRAEEGGLLAFEYALDADFLHVSLPPLSTGQRADGLWKHTCFEAFVATEGFPGYYEFNFSPSRDWAIYRFEDYRHGMSPAVLEHAPEISVRLFDDRLELDANVRLRELTGLASARRLRLALTSVIEEDNGRLSYWAWRHAPGKPDFHHPDGFALELEIP